jgi:hypothetical protein
MQLLAHSVFQLSACLRLTCSSAVFVLHLDTVQPLTAATVCRAVQGDHVCAGHGGSQQGAADCWRNGGEQATCLF